MFLKSIRLENVRCFNDLSIDFTRVPKTSENTGRALVSSVGNRKWTIILGENGTGKSTILRSCALLTAGSDSLVELLGEPSDWISNGAKFCRISGVITTKDQGEREISIEIDREDRASSVIARSTESLESLNAALRHTDRNYFVLGYGASRRISDEFSSRGRKGSFSSIRSRSVATLFKPTAELNPLESWAMEVDYRSDGKAMETVRKVLSDFLPGLKFYKIDKEKSELLFRTPDGIVPLRQLSDGYQNVAAWIGDMLYRVSEAFDDYTNPLKTRCLLLVDEVDLHLHPVWQRSLYDFLSRKLPNCQLVVTTHSPVTAQQADEGELHYLKRDGKNVDLFQMGGDPSDMLVSQLLLSEAFGLPTDESVDTEKARKRYQELRGKKKLSVTQEKELERLKSDLRATIDLQRDNKGRRTNIERLRAYQKRVTNS